MSVGELACTYATLILHDEGITVTAEKIATLVKAANVPVESYWPNLFAKLAQKRNIEDLIMSVGSSSSGAAPGAVAVPTDGASAPAAVEEKKEEAKEEGEDEDEDMCFSLFD